MFAKINAFLAKQTAWVALNPKKAVTTWITSLAVAFAAGHIL